MSNTASYRLTRRPSTTTSASGGYGGGYGLEYKPLNWLPNWEEILDKPLTYTPSAHTHAISEVNNLQGALDGKLGKTEKAVDSDKLGGRVAADYWHKANSNLSTIDWNCNNLSAKQWLLRRSSDNTTTFAAKLDNANNAILQNSSGSGGFYVNLNVGGNGQKYIMNIPGATGYVGLNVSDPIEQLDVNGNINTRGCVKLPIDNTGVFFKDNRVAIIKKAGTGVHFAFSNSDSSYFSVSRFSETTIVPDNLARGTLSELFRVLKSGVVEVENNLIVKGEAVTYSQDAVQTTSVGMTREAYVPLSQFEAMEKRLSDQIALLQTEINKLKTN